MFLLRLLDEWYDNCTVDGSEIRRSPPGIYNTLYIMGSLPYQLVQDFFHQQYDNDTVLNISRTSLLFKPMLNFIELFFFHSHLKKPFFAKISWGYHTVDGRNPAPPGYKEPFE